MSIREQLENLAEKLKGNEFIGNNIVWIKRLCIAAAIVLIGAIFILPHDNSGKDVIIEEDKLQVSEQTVPDKIFVDIGGEVNHPMVAELDDGSRIEDAIEVAGGLTAEADVASINRAAFISDGDKIYIPSKEEMAGSTGVGLQSSADTGYGAMPAGVSTGKVNINLADSEQLQTLTGVGPVTADKIIEYRESNGRFTNIEDIKNVSGIGDKTYEKLKDSITTT